MLWLFIGLGGAFGAMSRYTVSIFLKPYSKKLPFATIVINCLGSFLFGFFLASGLRDSLPTFYFLITTGFLGAFTTFSTFSFEAVNLLNSKQFRLATIYLLSHFFLPITFAFLGLSL